MPAPPNTPPATAPATTPASVRQRRVMYLSGFDPQGPAHYHQLYRDEAALQAQAGGLTLQVGPRYKAGPHIAAWDITLPAPDGPADAPPRTRTHYECLRWDDLVRAHWPRGRWGLLGRTAWASWQLWRGGVMWRVLRSSWPQFTVIAFPGVALAVLSLALAGLLGASLAGLLHGQWLASALACGLGLPLLAGLGLWAERRSHSGWLMRSMACLVQQARGQTPALEVRLDQHAQHLLQALLAMPAAPPPHTHTADPTAPTAPAPDDELLLVGHSSGAMLAVSVLARALAAWPPERPLPAVALLTLGHCTPMLSFQPEAQRFRAELTQLGHTPGLTWVDLSAPPDGCCFPLFAPTRFPGAPVPRHPPKLLNARFAQRFSPARYRHVKADKFRCHFQYLMASDRPSELDYFSLSAGPLSLAQRCATWPSVTQFTQFQRLGPLPW